MAGGDGSTVLGAGFGDGRNRGESGSALYILSAAERRLVGLSTYGGKDDASAWSNERKDLRSSA